MNTEEYDAHVVSHGRTDMKQQTEAQRRAFIEALNERGEEMAARLGVLTDEEEAEAAEQAAHERTERYQTGRG